MKRIYQVGNKWYYEFNGEIIAVESSREMVVACGDARVKASQPTQRAVDGFWLCAHCGCQNGKLSVSCWNCGR